MAQQSRTTLKSYFNTGDTPTEAEFIDVFDSVHVVATDGAVQVQPAEGAFIDGDKTKLDGIATGATANSADATLLARANHTGTQAISTVTGLQTALDAKAPLASPALTGTPTAPTAAGGTNTTQVATTAFVQGELPTTTALGDSLISASSEAAARAVIGASASWVPKWVSGRIYGSPTALNIESTAGSLPTEGAGDILYVQRYVPNSVTLDAMVFQIVTAVASSNVRLAIYTDNEGTWVGGTRLVETGNVSSATAEVKTAPVSVTLAEGMYWLAIHVSGAVQIAYETDYAANGRLGSSTAGANPGGVPTDNQTYGTLPTTAAAATYTFVAPGYIYPYIGLSVA